MRNGTALARSRQWTTVANRGVRNMLVIGEFSIALVLLAGAGLMLRSFLLLQTVDPGFRPERLLIMRIDLHVGRTAAQQVAYFAMPSSASGPFLVCYRRRDFRFSVVRSRRQGPD